MVAAAVICMVMVIYNTTDDNYDWTYNTDFSRRWARAMWTLRLLMWMVQLIGCKGMCEKEGCQNGGGHCHPICVVFCYHTSPQEFEPFIIRVLLTL